MGKMAAVAACASITVAYLALQPFPRPLYVLSNTSEAAFSLIPLLLSLYVLRTKTPFIKSTRWFAFGFLLWSLGEVTYSIYALFLGIAIPYPSIADLFWLIGYTFILVGMVAFIWPFRIAIKRESLEIAISLSAMFSVHLQFFLFFRSCRCHPICNYPCWFCLPIPCGCFAVCFNYWFSIVLGWESRTWVVFLGLRCIALLDWRHAV